MSLITRNWLHEVLESPEMSDDDINYVKSKLNLQDFDVNRRAFLQDLSSVDVSACPGSGKTTLAIAKILALNKKWTSNQRGMLLLSHTNVAKDEIRLRVASTGESMNVDGRPHFVGTIHSFVLRFLAAPYLRYLGFAPNFVNDEITSIHRRKLYETHARKLKGSVNARAQNKPDLIGTTIDKALTIYSSNQDSLPGSFLLQSISSTTDSYLEANRILLESAKDGYFKFNEIFPFAEAYLDRRPEIVKLIRNRFPFILIDEMQDTSLIQRRILEKLFPADLSEISIQRIGDPNQAIYEEISQTSDDIKSELDCSAFPRMGFHSISDSHRITPINANMSNFMALHEISPDGLRGLRNLEKAVAPAFIVFKPHQRLKVIPYFKNLCRTRLPKSLLATQKVAAIGARASIDGDVPEKQIPKALGHYTCEEIIPDISKTRGERSLFHTASSALERFNSTGEASNYINLVARAILRYLNANLPLSEQILISNRPFLKLQRLAHENQEILDSILTVVIRILSSRGAWTNEDMRELLGKTKMLTETLVSSETPQTDFFHIPMHIGMRPGESAPAISNGPQLSNDPGKIEVEVATIHSVKGETHLATLLLDTFNRTHFIKKLTDRLVGKKGKEDKAQKNRVRLAYVAMTRPTHFLAVGAVESSLGTNEANIQKTLNALQSKGWEIHRLET